MLTGSNLLHAKQFNLRIVHETIRLRGPLCRADVARLTALTGQTVSNLVKELVDLGLVVETPRRRVPHRRERRGAPATDLAVNPDGAFAVGLDFNRDHLTGVLVDLAGTVRQRIAHDVDFPAPAETLDLMVDTAEALIARQGVPRGRVRGVGIGVPGLMQPAPGGGGYVVAPTAFPGWHDVPLAAWLEERLGLPVLLENNATAAAVGERWYGAGRDLDTFFYLFLGSGLGGGLVVNGRPYGGATGNAGEIAYLPPRLDADPIDGDHAGTRFYLPYLLDRLRASGAPARTAADLAPLLAAGHPVLLEWMDTAAAYLTGLVLAVEYVLDPPAIVFGGRLPEAMIDALHRRVAAALPARRVRARTSTPRLVMATTGADAAALGVATLPIHALFAPSPQVLLKPNRRHAAAAPRPAAAP